MRMSVVARLLLSLAALVLVSCSSDGADPSPDAPPAGAGQPTWRLEDIQPQSSRFGQTYGLDTFSAKVVVVTLVEGY